MTINILVVDDSVIMRMIIRKTIESFCIRRAKIYEASNGREGLEILAERPVDLLLLDVNMPVMDGIEMLITIRRMAKTRELRVVMISTENHHDLVGQLSQENTEFLQKPFAPESLIKKLSKNFPVDDVWGSLILLLPFIKKLLYELPGL